MSIRKGDMKMKKCDFSMQLLYAVATALLLLLCATALSEDGWVPSDCESPGWGWGDENHEHNGPPGQDDDSRPGHGWGDENHDHSGGPPGKK